MRADREPSVVLRFGGKGSGFVALLFALFNAQRRVADFRRTSTGQSNTAGS